jgi:hypothetical protein
MYRSAGAKATILHLAFAERKPPPADVGSNFGTRRAVKHRARESWPPRRLRRPAYALIRFSFLLYHPNSCRNRLHSMTGAR